MHYLDTRLDIEWQILEGLSKIQNTFFDILAFLISQLGYGPITFVVILFVYYVVDKKTGEKLSLIIAASTVFNALFKSFFMAKRPFQFEGREHLRKLSSSLDSAGGTSFPSGHSQNAGTIYTLLFMHFKKKWVRIVSIILLILIPLSRVYLGVHFPGDVIVGLLLGIGIAVGLSVLYDKIQKPFYKYLIFIIISIITIPFIIIHFNDVSYTNIFKNFGFLVGLLVSFMIENKYINFDENVSLKTKLFRLLIASIICIAVYGLGSLVKIIVPSDLAVLYNLVSFLRYFLVSISGFLIVPLFLKNKKREVTNESN